MTLDYSKVWEVMNELEMVTSKVCSAREILESALNALENHKYDKAEALMYAADEFLQYYLKDFDEKFKTAWSETVVKLNEDRCSYFMNDTSTEEQENMNSSFNCYNDDYIIDPAGNDLTGMFNYYDNVMPSATQRDMNKVKKWILPVQEIENGDTMENEYFVTFPDDLLEAANFKEGDSVNWIDNEDGSFTLTKTNG